MPVLSIYTAGVSTTGIELINEAVEQVFGECSVEELGRDTLRYKVRSSVKDTSVVLVILDSMSAEECKDIEDGLYNSDKYYNYTDDKSLVKFLNGYYDISLDVPEDISPVVEPTYQGTENANTDNSELIETYESRLNDKDNIIKTLNYHIKELQGIIDDGGYAIKNDELNKATEENLSLKNRVSDLYNKIEELKALVQKSDDALTGKEGIIAELQEKLSKLENLYDSVNKELSQERVTSSQKSGVIRDKDREIQRLQNELDGYYKTENNIKELETLVDTLKSEIRNLNIDLSSKESEISRLKSDIREGDKLGEEAKKYKELFEESESKCIDLEKNLRGFEEKYSDFLERSESLSDELDVYKDKVKELQSKYDESEKYLAQANSDKIALNERLRLLEGTTDRDENVESAIIELSKLRRKYTELKMNVFNIISSKALPQSGVKVPLIKGIIKNLENVRFVFSGSTESRKGTYKCLFNEFAENYSNRYLIVDVSSETAVDYVFQMRSIVNGISWFITGGGVQKHLSSTCLPNVKVLMHSVGYINDGYFLTVDWERRLTELENSGYNVVIYCGDLSNLVSRVLFESFSDVGDVSIYIHGNALGSRTIIANAMGLAGIKNSSVKYFDYDKNTSKFYGLMSKKCPCEILSYGRS